MKQKNDNVNRMGRGICVKLDVREKLV